MIEVSEHGLDGIGGLFGMVKGDATRKRSEVERKSQGIATLHIREQVMNDVVLDNAVEEMAANKAKFSVNSGQRTLDKGPGAGLEVRHVHVGMVKVGNGNYETC